MSGPINRGLLGLTILSLAVTAFTLIRNGASSPAEDANGTKYRPAPTPIAKKKEPRQSRPLPTVQLEQNDGAPTEGALALCQSQLADTRTKLNKFLPPEVRFEQSSESPELAESLEPKILLVFDADQPAHDLECRGGVCRLELAWNQGADRGTWQETIQRSTLRNEVCGLGFHSGRPTTDAITGAPLETEEVWLTMCDEETLAGQPAAKAFLQEFVESGDIEACKDKHPDRGIWSIRIAIQNGTIEVADGGDLAATETGKCLGAAMRDMAKKTELPDNTRGAFLYHDMDI